MHGRQQQRCKFGYQFSVTEETMAKENKENIVIPEIDTRTIERKLKSGEITEEEYKKYLDSLEECTDYDTVNEAALIKEANIKRNY
jgi:3-hydroxyacyl-CoA dehydrogenase